MDRIERQLDNIEGNQYEERAINRILVRAAFLGIERAQVAFSQTGQYRQEVHDGLTAAVRTGLISRDEYYDLTEADLIVCGRNRRHLVAEISLGPDEEDISSALRRARILRIATGEPVIPVVAAPNPKPKFVSEAEARNVTVLDIPA